MGGLCIVTFSDDYTKNDRLPKIYYETIFFISQPLLQIVMGTWPTERRKERSIVHYHIVQQLQPLQEQGHSGETQHSSLTGHQVRLSEVPRSWTREVKSQMRRNFSVGFRFFNLFLVRVLKNSLFQKRIRKFKIFCRDSCGHSG